MAKSIREPAEGHASRRDTAEGNRPRNADDVEGHALRRGPGDSMRPRDTADDIARRRDPAEGAARRGEDDVEGHSMFLNPGIARDLARAREKDIQRRTERHGLEEEARRPRNPKR